MHDTSEAPAQLNLGLESAMDQTVSGFRLKRLEIYNWGTFDGQVWSLNLDGQNGLLTGDIGSGKSTIVDAVTTLLVPSHRAAYNKAAGADSKERSARSYVLGYYKSGRSESGVSAKPVALRDINSYSVILGVFHNQGFNQTVTLAQVYWMKDLNGQPERFYVGAESPLSISGNFSGFGADISTLRKRLRGSGAEVFETFPQYSAWFRRRFGIESEQALELFHQTVSMKSVGNLTDFVRQHMLESFDVGPKIGALLQHFDDLNSAHEAVLKAAKQIELLQPLVVDCQSLSKATAHSIELRSCRDSLTHYFGNLKQALVNKRLSSLAEELLRQDAQIRKLSERLETERAEQADLKQSIADNGGDRIERLTNEIRQKDAEMQQRKKKALRYEELIASLSSLGLTPVSDENAFIGQRQTFASHTEDAAQQDATLQNDLTEAAVSLKEGRSEHQELSTEIKSLKSRRNNIPAGQVSMRADLCKALNLSEQDMPFAGEVLQVREQERDWEGAAERVLHNFGLSLLVPDNHYADVAEWVERTNLRGRIVYYRVRPNPRKDMPELSRDSLASKIDIKPDSPFYDWLQVELANRFNHICCDNQERFRREHRAITRAAQIKAPGERHEKDDRHRLDDRSRYILGWTNASKIAALENKLRVLESQLQKLGDRIALMQSEQQAIKLRLDALSKLEEYVEYRDIDWRILSTEIAGLQEEKRQLESASDLLQQLTEKLANLTAKLKETQAKLDNQLGERGKTEQRRSDAQQKLVELEALLNTPERQTYESHFPALDSVRAEVLGEHNLTVESCDNKEKEIRQWLQDKIDNEEKKSKRLRDRIIHQMTDYTRSFPLDTQQVDVSIESAGEYEKMLTALQSDDLPRFQARFKELLNENTIREVAQFQTQLSRERETIKERIAHINESLTKIDYNAGRYILLEAQVTQDAEIRDFQVALQSCTEGTLTGSDDEQYSESKFLQVKAIIERFRGREGLSDLDQRWTQRVTDVRNWFTFAASERWREDHTEYEHYSDSGGKSGGQKEKLAYTVLAASLAYQFGLDWSTKRSRTFRFVVIDEAFGRGSDESAQYGLRLFEQLNLQLLVVTPLQKIHVIEPFVSSVGFVHNDNGNSSKLRNLSIEDYKAERDRNAYNDHGPSHDRSA